MPRLLALLAAAALALVAACSHPDRLPPVPRADTARAQPLGIPNARFFADGDIAPMIQEGRRSLERETAALRAEGKTPTLANLPPAYYLAVSGGGDNGAFGAGLLNGWSETGTRPEFKMVTGVSTGALIAPFAFLGPQYDPVLREVYTTLTPDRIFRTRGLSAALFNDAMADSSPLADVIAKYADEKMFAAIAREYNEGRLLLIGTTDLDAQRPVIWNIGALAASGKPEALKLFRQILRASAAIPGLFEPVMIDVELDGKKFQEMHVDGGTMAQLFLYPPTLEAGRLLKRKRSRLHHPQCTLRSRLLQGRAPDHQHRRPRHQHHAGSERSQRHPAHLLRQPARRRRLQPCLHRRRFHAREEGRVRAGLHAGTLPVRL